MALCLAAAGVAQAQRLELPVAAHRPPTHAELVRALGEPPRVDVLPERLEPKPGGGPVRSADSGLFGKLVVHGGELVLSYPALGLVVTIDREDRPLADPPIRSMQLSTPTVPPAEPVQLATPQGLSIGQPRQQALELAARHFRPRAAAPGSESLTFVAETGRPLAWARPTYELVLAFDQDQRLIRLHYEFKPGLTRPGKWALAGTSMVAAAAVAFALRWLWQTKLGAPSLPVASASTTRLIGRSLVGIGALTGIGSVGALVLAAYVAVTYGGNAYGGMGAFVLGMYAMMGLLMAAVLWFLGRHIEGSA